MNSDRPPRLSHQNFESTQSDTERLELQWRDYFKNASQWLDNPDIKVVIVFLAFRKDCMCVYVDTTSSMDFLMLPSAKRCTKIQFLCATLNHRAIQIPSAKPPRRKEVQFGPKKI